MKLSEFKNIMPHLPDDIEITVGQVSISPNTTSRKPTLKPEYWGNHDGRYNVRCTVCDWVSDDIRQDGYAPEFCPKGCNQ